MRHDAAFCSTLAARSAADSPRARTCRTGDLRARVGRHHFGCGLQRALAGLRSRLPQRLLRHRRDNLRNLARGTGHARGAGHEARGIAHHTFLRRFRLGKSQRIGKALGQPASRHAFRFGAQRPGGGVGHQAAHRLRDDFGRLPQPFQAVARRQADLARQLTQHAARGP